MSRLAQSERELARAMEARGHRVVADPNALAEGEEVRGVCPLCGGYVAELNEVIAAYQVNRWRWEPARNTQGGELVPQEYGEADVSWETCDPLSENRWECIDCLWTGEATELLCVHAHVCHVARAEGTEGECRACGVGEGCKPAAGDEVRP